MSLFSKQFNLQKIIGNVDNSCNQIPKDVSFYTGCLFPPMILGNLAHTSTVIFKKALLKQIGLFDETVNTGEDYRFHLQIASATPIGFIDYSLIYYSIMQEDALTSKKYHSEIAQNFLTTLQESLRLYKGKITLPKAMVRTCLADAYNWNGAQQALANHKGAALLFFIKSICVKPLQKACYKNMIKLMLNSFGFKMSY